MSKHMFVNNFIILYASYNAQGSCYVSICLREMEVDFDEYDYDFSNDYVFTVLMNVCVKLAFRKSPSKVVRAKPEFVAKYWYISKDK